MATSAASATRPAFFWLVIGCVAGASFATFGGIGQSISELRGRATALVPFPGAPPPDVPAGVAPSLAPLAEARTAPAALAPVLLPEATSEEEAAPVALAGPPKPAAVPVNLQVEFGGTDVRPTVSSTPVAPGAPPPAPPRDAAFEVNHGREDPALPHILPVLAVPSAPAVVARRDATALSFRPRTSRIVVQAPQNMPPDRREAALSRLTESDWSAEEAASSPFTVSETHVRYYHAQDRRAAEDLAGLFDASARDFTSYTPSPDEGLLELWLSGKGAPPVIRQARSRSTANSATPTRSSPRGTNLFDRMANALEGTSGGSSRGTWREGSDDGSSGSARGESGSRSRSASSADGRSSVGNGSRGDEGRAGDRSGAGGAGGSSSGGGGGSSSGSGGSSSSGGASSSNGGESSSGGGSPSAGSGGTSGAGNGNASGGRGGTGGGNGGERGNSGDHGRGADNAGGNGKGGGNNGRGGGNGGGKGGNNGRGNGR